jgi:hypothetical protein
MHYLITAAKSFKMLAPEVIYVAGKFTIVKYTKLK